MIEEFPDRLAHLCPRLHAAGRIAIFRKNRERLKKRQVPLRTLRKSPQLGLTISAILRNLRNIAKIVNGESPTRTRDFCEIFEKSQNRKRFTFYKAPTGTRDFCDLLRNLRIYRIKSPKDNLRKSLTYRM